MHLILIIFIRFCCFSIALCDKLFVLLQLLHQDHEEGHQHQLYEGRQVAGLVRALKGSPSRKKDLETGS